MFLWFLTNILPPNDMSEGKNMSNIFCKIANEASFISGNRMNRIESFLISDIQPISIKTKLHKKLFKVNNDSFLD